MFKIYMNIYDIYEFVKSPQFHLTLFYPMDGSPPGSSVHGIFQARILEWVSIPFSRGSFPPRDQTCVCYVSCIAGRSFAAESSGKPLVETGL